jgi:hypothetical protein
MQMTSEACLSKPAENARLRLGDGGASGDHAKEYLRKHQQAPLQIGEAPSLKLRLVVVIPCRASVTRRRCARGTARPGGK